MKRVLRAKELRIEPLERAIGLLTTVSLDPEPIPLDVTVLLIGDRRLYYLLAEYDPEFAELFKVAADFEDDLRRSRELSPRLRACWPRRPTAGVCCRLPPPRWRG